MTLQSDAVGTALQRSLASSRERGWNFRMGDDGAGAPQQPQQPEQPWQAPPPWPPNLDRGTYDRIQANPEAAERWFNASDQDRGRLMMQDPNPQIRAQGAYLVDPNAANTWFNMTDEQRRYVMGG